MSTLRQSRVLPSFSAAYSLETQRPGRTYVVPLAAIWRSAIRVRYIDLSDGCVPMVPTCCATQDCSEGSCLELCFRKEASAASISIERQECYVISNLVYMAKPKAANISSVHAGRSVSSISAQSQESDPPSRSSYGDPHSHEVVYPSCSPL
jgi:hypothetical protein